MNHSTNLDNTLPESRLIRVAAQWVSTLCLLALALGCGSDPDPVFISDSGVDSTSTDTAGSDTSTETDAGVDTAADSGAEDSGPDAALSGCEAVCEEQTRANVSECFNDGEPVSESECFSACDEFGLAEAADCIVAAASDCAEMDLCVIDDDYDPVTFEVDGTDAYMNGVIDSRTIGAVEALLADHPEVTRIVLEDCPGSADDESNLVASRLVREAGLATHIPADGEVASGGVDFFIAGATRTADVEGGALIGVHSWAAGSLAGSDLPRDHPDHSLFLDYYEEMGIPAEFYWFTLEAAPPEGIHWMTVEEVAEYGLETE